MIETIDGTEFPLDPSLEHRTTACADTAAHRNDLEDRLRAHTGDLVRHVERLGLSRADAQDCVQETILAVWIKASGREIENLAGYLYRSTTNRATEMARKSARRGRILRLVEMDAPIDGEPSHTVGATIADPSDAFLDLEREYALSPAVRTLLASVPSHQRELLVMAADDVTYDEMAARTGVKVGTVRSRLHRARERIIHLFGEDFGDELLAA